MLKGLIRRLSFFNVGTVLRWQATRSRTRTQPFLLFEDQVFTYAQTYEESLRYARLFRTIRDRHAARGRLEPGAQLAIGLYMENTPEFVFATFGAALSNDVLFGLNTGFRGDTLAAVLGQAKVQLLLTERKLLPEIPRLDALHAEDVLLADGDERAGERSLAAALRLTAGAGKLRPPSGRIDNTLPFIVIYTSGTTGLPKGVPCPQFKLLGAGLLTRRRVGLGRDDRGYVCMPLFHSNSWFLGVMPILVASGSFVLKRRFSASAFDEDVVRYGFTYLNYVGQPLHYILAALERKYGSLSAAESALAHDPRNRFRTAHGNGALPADREKLVRCLGMEHIYELYGSTEAPVSTVVKPGDPQDSVGELPSKKIVILNERDEICPPGVTDAQGRLLNYEQAVGEICRKLDTDNIFFDGYLGDRKASEKKFRGGYFHSGDLGHVRLVGRKRYLYFNGRTDDWIRKDGENFSAENVAHYACRIPGVAMAVAFGIPSEVSDEKVMVAVQMRDGSPFDPRTTFDYYRDQAERGGMDPKWMPDFIRVVSEFEMTETQKLLVRPLKRRHFRPGDDAPVYFRERGDESYRLLTPSLYQEIEQRFRDNGRLELLGR